MSGFAVAAAAYPIEPLRDWAEYEARIDSWLGEAAAGGASLAVFPEYGAMEIASLDPATMGDLTGSLESVSALEGRADELHARLAARHGLHVLAASLPARRGDGAYVNRARLFTPGGKVGVQDKLVMTRFEREEWHVSAGGPLRLFDTALGRIGVTICYDSEFPLLARALAESGCQLLLVPSCTDTLHGYWRVRVGCQARALEQQMVVVHAPTVGRAPWSPAVDENHGAAAIYGPPDKGFPADGVLAIGDLDRPGWTFGEVDPEAIATARSDGMVLNFAHWGEQPGAGVLPTVEIVDLR